MRELSLRQQRIDAALLAKVLGEDLAHGETLNLTGNPLGDRRPRRFTVVSWRPGHALLSIRPVGIHSHGS
ncbi:MAG: hypothetical protein KIT84_42380 [Labilithrix sp.]|nr:hypothetical protein [Labilithrix sp.]MCW5817724.1 hypothetical protein [Labilithrix sp.]